METANEDTNGLMKDISTRKLDVKITNSDMVHFHRVGKRAEDRTAPRVVRFTTHNTKTAVMRNARKLKGTNLFIIEDD